VKLLISNDDGVNAEGIQVLAEVLSSEYQTKVVAPDRDHSGASSSLTLSRPLRVMETAFGYYCIDGTPTDAVHLGVSSLFDEDFDRVVSGINSHENLGDDVLYSGTVAAAMEGRFLKQPAIAVSLVNKGKFHYHTAARVVSDLLRQSADMDVPARTILNVNVPDVPYEELKGVRVTRLGHRAKGLPPEEVSDPRGRQRYWISVAGEGDDAGEGTDFHAVSEGYVSVTPLHVDMTRHESISKIKEYFEG
jgi:5'-nucleotidase